MKNLFFTKYYRVYKNDTSVTEISVNDFKPVPSRHNKSALIATQLEDVLCSIPYLEYMLPQDESMFYGYLDKATAMEKAKAGALAYISRLIEEGEAGIKKLAQYRTEHYEDLNIHLLDANIRKFRKEMQMK